MSSSKIGLVALVAVVVLGGVWYINNIGKAPADSQSARLAPNKMQKYNAAPAVKKPVADNSNASISQASARIDAEMTGLDQDSTAVDSGIKNSSN